MISQSKTRVQAIKSKFENLGTDNPTCKAAQLGKHTENNVIEKECRNNFDKENKDANTNGESLTDVSDSSDDWSPKASPNTSYLYSKGVLKRNVSDGKKSLTRQTSDPGKKLHRSHAFRCDRSQKIVSPKRHGSCYGRSETGDFTLKMGEKRLSRDRLKKLGNLLEVQMKKEGYVVNKPGISQTMSDDGGDISSAKDVAESDDSAPAHSEVALPVTSIPDSEVPQHILDQYAKVIKPKKNEDHLEKKDGMTDSGVSSETENFEDEKSNKVKRLLSQLEKNNSSDSEKSNLELMVEICSSSDTIKLERKNPHVKITDTLKKALKQPLPAGPPPKKPPRTFASIPESPEKQKKDTKKMLEKLEQVLQKRESQNQNQTKNVYDVVEADHSPKRNECLDIIGVQKIETSTSVSKKPKEIHYLCTEILGITNRTSLPSQISLNSCFKSLNCAIVPNTNSTLSLPYTRLSTGSKILNACSCSTESLNKNPRLSTFSGDTCTKCLTKDNSDNFSTFLNDKCSKCQLNDEKHGFKCHLSCKCKSEANFFVPKETEHIYDVPFVGDDGTTIRNRSNYGALNLSKSLEDLRSGCQQEADKIYDIPCELSRPATPEMPELEHAPDAPVLDKIPEHVGQSPKDTEATETSDTSLKLREFRRASSASITESVENRSKCVELSPKTGEKSPKCVKMSPKTDEKSPKGVKLSPETVKTNPKIVESIPKSPETRPRDPQRPRKLEFQKLRQSFESGFLPEDRVLKFENGIPKSDFRNQNECNPKHTIIITDTNKVSKTIEELKTKIEKPPMKPKPIFIKNNMSKSSENLADNLKSGSKKPFTTEGRKYRKERDASSLKPRASLVKRDSVQQDIDRENLNRLMNEIYATVTAATDDMDNKPGCFPTEGEDGSTSEDSVKLTRSLTEKRKNYVRRVSSKVAYLEQKNARTRYRHQTSVCSYQSEIQDNNPYSTFRSWKSFRTSQKNLDKMSDRRSTDSKANLTDSSGNLLSMKDEFDTFDSSETIDRSSIDEKTGCVDIELPFVPRERGLFNVCLLVGLNHMTGQAYVKSIFPNQVQVPPHIENLIFPETLSAAGGDWPADARRAQTYSLVLTDERGERSYGYCRRVLPEGATTCLPLCYCLIGKYRAPEFYYKVLQEIESHHGSSEVEIHSILQQLFETDFPNPGEEITITYTSTNDLSRTFDDTRKSLKSDSSKYKTLPNMRNSLEKSDVKRRNSKFSDENDSVNNHDLVKSGSERCVDEVPVKRASEMFVRSESARGLQFGDLENNNSPKAVMLSLDGMLTKTLKRPIEPRVDCDYMSILLDSIGAGVTIKVFGSLLLERKVLLVGDHLSQVSSCMEALQSALYPFVWQQPLISTIPAEIQKDVLEAPLPILAGMLNTGGDMDLNGVTFEEGMLIDLTHPSKVLFYQGDESTILPTSSYKTLKTSLQMESKKQDDHKMRNVMISEAFMRFFVDILGDFWRFFSKGELKEGMLGKGDVVFDKENFIKSSPSKQNQYFLEWFTETAMFNHFIQNMASSYNNEQSDDSLTCMKLVDTPLPDFYELFQQRVNARKSARKNSGSEKSNYKLAVNKRVKLLKTKLRELVT